MIDARILDGDVVYIRQQPVVENGEIAAVRIGDEATLKKVYYNGRRIILRACNPLYADMEYEGEELNDVEILGQSRGVFQYDLKFKTSPSTGAWNKKPQA